MKKLFLFACAFLALGMSACSEDDNNGFTPPSDQGDKYKGGFYVYNEGSYGRTPASVNYYNADEGWSLNLFQTNNPGETLGDTGTVAVCDQNYMYLLAKGAPFLTKVGLNDFVKRASLSEEAFEEQAYGFALLDAKRGVLTTSSAAYIVTLDPLALSGEPFYKGGPMSLSGDVIVSGGYIFLLASANGDNAIKVFDASTLKFLKDVGTALTGFASVDNTLWAANGDKLVKIDLSTLASEEVALGDGISVHYNSMAYTPTCLKISRSGDALYFLKAVSSWTGGDVYKFTFASGEAEKIFAAPLIDGVAAASYGAGIQVDPASGDLYLVYATEYGANASIYVVDANTGEQKQMIPYTDTKYWFPSMILFR